MISVWIVEHGDYEQRGIVGVFATRELAEAHILDEGYEHEEPTEEVVWDRAPSKVTRYERDAIIVDDPATFRGPIGGGWKRTEPHIYEKAESYETLEIYCPKPVDESRIATWDVVNRYVEVVGNDEAAVAAQFVAQLEAVKAGQKPDA